MELKEILQQIEIDEKNLLQEELLKLDLKYDLLLGILKGYTTSKGITWTLKQSVNWLINVGVVGFDTLFADSEKVQTTKFANRSTKDLYLILRFYRPNLNLLDFIKTLVELVDEEEIHGMRCGDIQRVTWFAKINERNYGFHTRHERNYSNDGDSTLSISDYYNLTDLLKNNNKEDAKSADITEETKVGLSSSRLQSSPQPRYTTRATW